MRRHREAVSKRHANPRKGRSRALTLREERWERECACRPVEGGGWGRGVGGGGWGITAVPPHPFLHGFRGREGGLGGGPPTISFVFPLSFLWFSISSRERPGRRAKGSLQRAATARTADGNWVNVLRHSLHRLNARMIKPKKPQGYCTDATATPEHLVGLLQDVGKDYRNTGFLPPTDAWKTEVQKSLRFNRK